MNMGDTEIERDSFCNYYSGCYMACDEDKIQPTPPQKKLKATIPSDKKFPTSIRITSYYGKSSKKTVVKCVIMGWAGCMIDCFPDDYNGGAEFAEHGCFPTPNSFVKKATFPDTGEDFTISVTFTFPHQIIRRSGFLTTNHYDSVTVEFEPLILQTSENIPVGGRCIIDYGSNMVNRSKYHVANIAKKTEPVL